MARPPQEPKLSTGPPRHLIERIAHLQHLLENLPETIPLSTSPPAYSFVLDDEKLEDRGFLGALSHCLEINFETWKGKDMEIDFKERGSNLSVALIGMMKSAVKGMTSSDRERAGATIPKPKRKERADSGAADTNQPNDTASQEVKRTKTSSDPVNPIVTDAIEILSDDGASITAERTPLAPKPKRKQGTLADLGWKPWGEGEKAAYISREFVKGHKAQEEARDREERLKEGKKERERMLACEQQHRHRAQVKAAVDVEESRENINKVLMQGAEMSKGSAIKDIAVVSWPGHSDWRKSRNGTLGGAVEAQATRTNWYHPFLWVHIDKAIHKHNWSPGDTVKALKRDNQELFEQLHRATVWKWLGESKREWSEQTMKNVGNRHALVGSGRVSALTKHPEIVRDIKKTLQDIRTAHLPVSVAVARSIMIAIIKEKNKHILSASFKCSEQFVRAFLQTVMYWSPRKATRAASHLPEDAPEQCERTFFRLVYAMKWQNIPAQLLINVDQLGNYLLPNLTYTWHDTGAKQVDSNTKDEKRAYTLLVASTPTGEFLPFQQVWSGKTKNSLPRETALRMNEAQKYGMHFTVANSQTSPLSHYSTLKTMKEWISMIMMPYVRHVIEEEGLEDDQMSILFIDIYPVHNSVEFQTHIFKEYPNIILIFVPENCTGIFQPADIGLQRIIKHMLKQQTVNYMLQSHKEQLARGITPESVKITNSLPPLRDATVAGLVHVYESMQTLRGHEIVQKAWQKSIVKEWCLSEKCLTGQKAQNALNNFLCKDPTLRDEIEARVGNVQGLSDGTPSEYDIDHTQDDDTDLSLETILQSMNSSTDNAHPEAEGDAENIWAYNDAGDLWSDVGALPIQEI
ncbi:hypothetical protein C0992_010825 [Termitomyces sp. T32_za158]|nr:hypothetical protein C0992_010825 [Termitomyces sp. T32_za158]